MAEAVFRESFPIMRPDPGHTRRDDLRADDVGGLVKSVGLLSGGKAAYVAKVTNPASAEGTSAPGMPAVQLDIDEKEDVPPLEE